MNDDVNLVIVNWGWPPAALSPNARVHWTARQRATFKYRSDCGLLNRASMGRWRPAAPWTRARVTLLAYAPCQRRRDADNLIASLKPAYDSLADAGLIQDDCGLTHDENIFWHVDPKRPRVVAMVRRLDRERSTS